MSEKIGEMGLEIDKLEFVFKEEKREFQRVPIPDGMHTFGLIRVQNAYKKKFESEEMEPAFKFVFQTKDIDGGFITIMTSQKTSSKSTLYKLLMSMTGNKIETRQFASKKYGAMKSMSQEAAMAAMQSLIGKWFYIQVINEPGKLDPSTTWASAANKLAMPHPDSDKMGDCREWFKANPGKFAKKGEDEISPPSLTGFENYPDAKEIDAVAKEFPYYYDITGVAVDKRENAVKLITLAISKQMDASRLKWRTCNKVDQLSKYLKQTVHDDVIPF